MKIQLHKPPLRSGDVVYVYQPSSPTFHAKRARVVKLDYNKSRLVEILIDGCNQSDFASYENLVAESDTSFSSDLDDSSELALRSELLKDRLPWLIDRTGKFFPRCAPVCGRFLLRYPTWTLIVNVVCGLITSIP